MKPIILCDIDGVMLDFLTPYLNYVYKITGKKILSENIKKYDLKIDDKIYYDFLKNMPLLKYYHGALNYFNTLSQTHDLILITAIDKTVSKKRIDNLKDLNYKKLIFSKEKEKYLYYDPVAIYEDCPETIYKYLSLYQGNIFTPIRPYTKNIKHKRVILYDYC